MKISVLSVGCILLLAGCANEDKKPPQVVAVRQGTGGTILPSYGLDSVRYGEALKAYPVGRYVDPNDPSVMHEGHILYRAERTAKWNLHPNLPVEVPLGPTVTVNRAAKQSNLLSSELQAELANQRVRGVETAEQNQRLSGMIDNLQGMMRDTQKRLEQSDEVKGELQQMKREIADLRLETEEERARKLEKSNKLGGGPSATPGL
jgi:hypothetical protein